MKPVLVSLLLLLCLADWGWSQGQTLRREQVQRNVWGVTPPFTTLPDPEAWRMVYGEVVNLATQGLDLWEWTPDGWKAWPESQISNTVIENVTTQNFYIDDRDIYNDYHETYYINNILRYISSIVHNHYTDVQINEPLLGPSNGVNRRFYTSLPIHNGQIEVKVHYGERNYLGELETGSDFTIGGPQEVRLTEPPLFHNPYTGEVIDARLYATYRALLP